MSYMFVPNFEAIGLMTLVLEPENCPASLAKKSGISQKRKKIFHMVVCLKIPFHPNQPTFGRDEVSFLFSVFFLPNFLYAFFSPKLQKHRNLIFCVKLLSCKRNFFVLKFFWGNSTGNPHKNGSPKKSIFLNSSS